MKHLGAQRIKVARLHFSKNTRRKNSSESQGNRTWVYVPHICIAYAYANAEVGCKRKRKEKKRKENRVHARRDNNRRRGKTGKERSAGNVSESFLLRYRSIYNTHTYLVEKISRAIRGRSQRLRWHTKTRDASSHPRPTATSLLHRGLDPASRFFRSPRSHRRRAAAAVPGCIISASLVESLRASPRDLPFLLAFLLTHGGGLNSATLGTRT